MGSSFKIGRLFGIDIGVHWSWLFILVLITWSFADGILAEFYEEWSAPQRYAVGAIIAVIFFASILAHELSHSIVAKMRGIEVTGITLFIFGGVSNLGREAQSAAEEFQIAIVGPLMSLLVAAIFAILWAVLSGPQPEAAAVAGYLAFINAVIAAFNMLPGFPLDGGRVFRSIVWWRNHNLLRATRVAARTGEVVAYILMGIGLIQFFTINPIGGVWMFLIGLFLRNASASSYEQMVVQTALSGLRARDLARSDFVPISPEITMAQLVGDYMLSGRGRCFPVMAGEELLGLITLTDAQKLDREQWPVTSVYRAMTPFERLKTIAPDEDAMKVLQMLSESDLNQIPVVEGRLLRGIISRGDVLRLIQVRQAVTIER
jgi:Zn-dependent protease/predicted transcriptional regulator